MTPGTSASVDLRHRALGDRERDPDAIDLGGKLGRAHTAHELFAVDELGVGRERLEELRHARRHAVDADAGRARQAVDAGQRLHREPRVPHQPGQVVGGDLAGDAVVPGGAEQVDLLRLAHEETQRAERREHRAPQRTVAGDVLAVPAPAEHEHVDPLAFHLAEHARASLDPQLVEVDAGAVFGGHEAERLHVATAVTSRTPSSSNVGPTRSAIGASASRSKP